MPPSRWGAVVFVVCCLAAGAAYAHGVVGDYVFIEPLITEDPIPANEWDIAPQWTKGADHQTAAIGSSIEKLLGTDSEGLPRFSVGVGSAWNYQWPTEGPDVHGFDNVELDAKYAFWIVPPHEFLMSLAAILQLPTGNSDTEERSHTSFGPELLWAKALGDLPNLPVVKYLRPLGFQANLGYLPALSGPTSHQLFANQTIEYSLLYLSNSVRDFGLTQPFRNLFLFTEFNYSQLIAGPSGQTFPNIVMTPGIAYVGYQFQVSVGTQFALNNASIPDTHAAVLALLDIFYDSIIPQGNWKLWGK